MQRKFLACLLAGIVSVFFWQNWEAIARGLKLFHKAPTYGDSFTITNARFDDAKLSFTVSYGGGCRKHKFSAKLENCTDEIPPACIIWVHHDGNGDSCERFDRKDLTFTRPELGMDKELKPRKLRLRPNFADSSMQSVIVETKQKAPKKSEANAQ